jgi:hypothetical protein
MCSDVPDAKLEVSAGAVKRATQDLPIDGHNALTMHGKLRHEALK